MKSAKKSKLWRNVKNARYIYLLIFPAIVFYIIFNYMPVIQRHTRTLDVATLLATAGYIAIVARSRADTSYAIIFIAIILTAALNGQSAIHRLFKSRKWLIMGGG